MYTMCENVTRRSLLPDNAVLSSTEHRAAVTPTTVIIISQQRCVLLPNYFGHLLIVLLCVIISNWCATAALQVSYYQLHKVFVQVTDINDNAPVFNRDSIVLNISEATQPGTRFPLPVADDSDSEQYAVVEYRLEPSEMQRIFNLDVVTEADLSQQVGRAALLT